LSKALGKALLVFITISVLTAGIAGCGVTRVNNTNVPEQADTSDENQLQDNAKLHNEAGLPDEANSASKTALSDDDGASQSTASAANASSTESSDARSSDKESPDAGSPDASSSDTAESSGASGSFNAAVSPNNANPSGTTDSTGELNSRGTAEPAALPDDTIEWNGSALIRENYRSNSQNVSVPNNVITTENRMLTVYYANSFGSDSVEYVTTQVVQVKLDDIWFTIPLNLSQGKESLTLDPFSTESDPFSLESMTGHSVDLTPLGDLPPGQYRFVERFFMERLQYEYYTLAYFWIINPGDARPPESETSGQARSEDIIFNIEPSFEARRVITDRDEILDMLITNTSGKKYVSTKAVLEKLQNGKWEHVEYTYSNLGMVYGWQTTKSSFYLNKQLEAGEYRIRLSLNVFETTSGLEPVCIFKVMPFNDAPEPEWDVSQLSLSQFDDSSWSADVNISLANTVLNKSEQNLHLTITAKNLYIFGDPYSIEVFLNGKWYGVPLNTGFNSIAYSTDSTYSLTCNPAGTVGILPAGQYRIIKEFDLLDRHDPSLSVFLAKEFAAEEFTVAETLERQR